MNVEKSTAHRPDRGSRRVAAWVYDVINPLIDTLPVEISSLERGNTTWRFQRRELEHLRSIASYLPPDGRHVLRDFTRFAPEAKRRFDEHDQLLVKLRDAAAEAHAELMQRDDFVQTAQDALKAYTNKHPERDSPRGVIAESEFPDLAAERVINRFDQLPSHFIDADFWSEHGAALLPFARGSRFEQLEAACHALLAYDRELIEWLADESFALCSEHDIPAAPPSGWASNWID